MAVKGNNELSALRQAYGDHVELHDEDGTARAFQILAELTVNGSDYAILQSKEMRQEDEIEVFKVVPGADGEAQLETVTDEEEWELVEEAFDDSQFGSDDRP
ncbi:DUF1292 domain-containing protein [Cohnella cholangitidis]|uniref:DUF1292 domain-containing protein n=1 Tax=Cohnella cholangitidis TaxID=2598458 RepID=A0A7G5BUA7_9BACL|nr:DUF1292 domain-containing protein [Cohnella cholangitidis]QMV40541.1 DUF1292 domain-containing protein [Cohnella cholangitidis]